MPSNNSMVVNLRKYKNLAMLISPGGWWDAKCDFALDNGAYACWLKGQSFKESAFINLLNTVEKAGYTPRWVVVPDAVCDAEKTNYLWKKWQPVIKQCYGFNCAFAVQDGHTPKDVPRKADVVFIGGSTEWKRKNIKTFCKHFPRVHVARINTLRWLWVCHNAGAESVDGTGWFRHPSRMNELISYLDISNKFKSKQDYELFNTSIYYNWG